LAVNSVSVFGFLVWAAPLEVILVAPLSFHTYIQSVPVAMVYRESKIGGQCAALA
jgi:hypothetical protein